jgi:flagellar biosynthesis/type III secretory pathway protein FliH
MKTILLYLAIFAVGIFIGTCSSKEKIVEKPIYKDKRVEVIPNGYVSGETLRIEKDKSYKEGITVGYNSGKTDGYVNGKTDGYNIGFSDGYKKCEDEITITIDRRRTESEKSNKNQVLFDVKR